MLSELCQPQVEHYDDDCFNSQDHGESIRTRYSAYCDDRCPLECTRNVFTRTVFTYEYPRAGYFDRYVNTSESLSVDSLVEVRVKYEPGVYVEYDEEAKMSGEDLLGIIGGHLHVFLGMSLMSFVEVFELVVFILYRMVVRSSHNIRALL